MIDIYTGDTVYAHVNMSYQSMLMIMDDTIIGDNQFIEFQFDDGMHGAIRKRCISGFTESVQEV